MRVRLQYSRQSGCRFLSHLDMVRVFVRALRRGQVPMAYSGGFNPQPRLAFAAPLPVGTAALAEFVEIQLTEDIRIVDLLENLNRQMPDGIKVLAGSRVPEGEGSLMARIDILAYEIELPQTVRQEAQEAVHKLIQMKEAKIFRKTKKGFVERDIKPYISKIALADRDKEDGWRLGLLLKTGPTGSVRPEEVLKAMGIEEDAVILRTGTLIQAGDNLLTPFDVMDGEVLYWKKRSS
jgi:radical SAM-linked protein